MAARGHRGSSEPRVPVLCQATSHAKRLSLVYKRPPLAELRSDESRTAELGSSAAYEERAIQCEVFRTKS